MDFAPSARSQSTSTDCVSSSRPRSLPSRLDCGPRGSTRSRSGPTSPCRHVAGARRVPRVAGEGQGPGLWNLFLPDAELGAGLSNVEYAPLAEEMGRSPFVASVFNCDAPDTGNMEVLYHYGSAAQKERWLKPLLDGEIRSAFCMTEPGVASSDATNMAATAVVEGDEVVLNGRKWWSTGIGSPDCKILIFMGLTDPEAHKYQRHSMVLVPMDTPGVKVERMLSTMGFYDEPGGHGEVSFTDVRLPLDAIIAVPDAASRSHRVGSGRAGCITACVWSVSRRPRSSWRSAAAPSASRSVNR